MISYLPEFSQPYMCEKNIFSPKSKHIPCEIGWSVFPSRAQQTLYYREWRHRCMRERGNIIKQWKKEQVLPYFGCCTADSQTDAGRQQLYNNGLLVLFSIA